MNSPLISIVTVTLNPSSDDLMNTIDSVISQIFADWELIIKDGGSTNGVLENIPRDARIKLFTFKDSGIFDAMNQGIKMTRGDYICLLNAGDLFFDENVLQNAANIIMEMPGTAFIYGDAKKLKSRMGYELYPAKLTDFFLFSDMICHQCWFVAREQYLQKRLYETDFPIGSDYRYLLHMIYMDKVAYFHIPKVLIIYKGDGVSQNPKLMKESYAWRIEAKKEYFPAYLFVFYSFALLLKNIIKKYLYINPVPAIYRWWRLPHNLRNLK